MQYKLIQEKCFQHYGTLAYLSLVLSLVLGKQHNTKIIQSNHLGSNPSSPTYFPVPQFPHLHNVNSNTIYLIRLNVKYFTNK